MNNLKLYNGVEMPPIGLGTYPMFGEELTRAVVTNVPAHTLVSGFPAKIVERDIAWKL